MTAPEDVTGLIWFDVGYRGEDGWNHGLQGVEIGIYRDGILIRTLITNAEGRAEMTITGRDGDDIIARIRMPAGWRIHELRREEIAVSIPGRGSFFLVRDDTPQAPTRPLDNISIRIDGEYLTDLDVPPTIIEGRTFVPVRAVTEAIGANVDWDSATRIVTIERGETIITMTIDSLNAVVNGSAVQLDVAPVIIDGRTMLPIRFIAESFGLEVDWDSQLRNVIITTQ